MTKLLPVVAIVCAALASVPLSAHVAAPHVTIQSVSELPRPLPLPYDEAANATATVAKARAQARREHKRLLIDLGGDWCLDCRILAGIMDLPSVKPFLDRHFVIVTVDIGRFDKNEQIAAHYGVTGRLAGVPAILAVDPVKDKLLNRGKLSALEDARHMTPQGLADWLAQWAA